MTPLEQVLQEAKAWLNDRGTMKSESSQITMRVIIRLCEALIYDEVRTPHPSRFHGPDDGLGLGPQ
jgi:hypothetical protein